MFNYRLMFLCVRLVSRIVRRDEPSASRYPTCFFVSSFVIACSMARVFRVERPREHRWIRFYLLIVFRINDHRLNVEKVRGPWDPRSRLGLGS